MADLLVVGGGISGLAAAYEAAVRGASVTLLEADDRLGGKIETARFAGHAVELGPDMFLTRVPWAVALAGELGLADRLLPPDTSRAWVWTRDRVRPLPAGLALGLPTDLMTLARSGVVSPLGLLRAGLDLVLPHRPPVGDVSAGSVVRHRFGNEVADVLVDPLLGGINAGAIDHLSLDGAAPQIAAAAREHRSLLLGLRRQATPAGGGPSPFATVTGGLERLVDALAARLAGSDVRLSCRVETIESAGRGVRAHTPGGAVDADAAVVTVPAYVAADLVARAAPVAARELEAIEHASVAVLLLAFDAHALPPALDGSGVLVPRRDRRLTTAITWYSAKWRRALEATGDGPPPVLFRISCGRHHDDRAADLDEDTLVARLLEELQAALGVSATPTAVRLVRWPRAFPQYTPGHAARVARIEAALHDTLPAVALAGAAYRGVGIPACIHQGREAADRLLDAVPAS